MKKILLSETTRLRALIYGMKHHLVNLYTDSLNYIPGAKKGLALGSYVLHRFIHVLLLRQK